MIDPDLVLLLVLTIRIWRGTITVQLHSVSSVRVREIEGEKSDLKRWKRNRRI